MLLTIHREGKGRLGPGANPNNASYTVGKGLRRFSAGSELALLYTDASCSVCPVTYIPARITIPATRLVGYIATPFRTAQAHESQSRKQEF
jgi:hypothetical protein